MVKCKVESHDSIANSTKQVKQKLTRRFQQHMGFFISE